MFSNLAPIFVLVTLPLGVRIFGTKISKLFINLCNYLFILLPSIRTPSGSVTELKIGAKIYNINYLNKKIIFLSYAMLSI